MTPRPPESATWATALAITAGSGVDSTSATEGAVRLHPVRRFVVVLETSSKRVPPAVTGSAQPEDH